VSQEVGGPAALRGFDDTAAHAVVLAEREARELGHDRVGTEHLLLGLLTNGSDASATLTTSGVTLAAARIKVTEAVGMSSQRDVGARGPLLRTPRAERALGRSARFAHLDGSDVITSDHVLRGVLDVEGTAGQVLRGLGVDVDLLRASLDAADADRAAAPRLERAVHADTSPRCSSCKTTLEGQLAYRVVTATSESGALREVALFSCRACGFVLGTA
jgi:ATP-dependent Clp protease ATP-binding subunit ClpC